MPKDYSFLLNPNQKKRYIAGSYDPKNHRPIYEIEIDVPKHVKNQVSEKQILVGTPENCQWGWDIENNSSWPAYVVIKKDGVLI